MYIVTTVCSCNLHKLRTCIGVCIYMYMYLTVHVASCRDGEVRLTEGENEWEGRLEVCLNQRWGTVSDDGWSEDNAQVVCRDLGYDINPSECAYVWTVYIYYTHNIRVHVNIL